MTRATKSLARKHAFITGGGTGIGAAIAASLIAQGAKVTIAGRRLDVLKQTAARLGLSDDSAITLDVTDRESVTSGVSLATARNGAIDILVNNAGRAASAPFIRSPPKLLADMLAVNVTGAWHVTQAILPGMLHRADGRIINIASTAGLTGYAYVTAYVAAKHALVGLTRALAVEVATQGITVNAVCPGFTETPLLEEALDNIKQKTGRSGDAARQELARANPMRRLVEPREVADAVCWLAAPGASAMNGQVIAVCGGELMTG